MVQEHNFHYWLHTITSCSICMWTSVTPAFLLIGDLSQVSHSCVIMPLLLPLYCHHHDIFLPSSSPYIYHFSTLLLIILRDRWTFEFCTSGSTFGVFQTFCWNFWFLSKKLNPGRPVPQWPKPRTPLRVLWQV